MALKFYNTLNRKKEIFKPISEKKVGIFSCGPTVYDFAHIGNFRAYLSADILKRWLKYNGYKVRHVMNITDVDDKIINRAKESKKEPLTLAGEYEKAFYEDVAKLGIETPAVFAPAS